MSVAQTKAAGDQRSPWHESHRVKLLRNWKMILIDAKHLELAGGPAGSNAPSAAHGCWGHHHACVIERRQHCTPDTRNCRQPVCTCASCVKCWLHLMMTTTAECDVLSLGEGRTRGSHKGGARQVAPDCSSMRENMRASSCAMSDKESEQRSHLTLCCWLM